MIASVLQIAKFAPSQPHNEANFAIRTLASSNTQAVSSNGHGARSGTASPVLGDRCIRGGKLALDVEGRAALADERSMQRADVGTLAIILLQGREPLGRAAEPAANGLHRGRGSGLPLHLGLVGQRFQNLQPAPDVVGQPAAVQRLLAAVESVGTVLLQAYRCAGASG